MRKTIFLFVALLSAMMLTGLKAQAQTEYVTDVYVIGSDYSSTIDDLYEKSFKPYGWKRINYDLNKGARGHYVKLLYKTGTDVTEAITDLYLWVGDNNTSEKTFTFEGRTYTRSSYNGDEDFLRSKGDLNTKAGGAYIFVYYTKDNTNYAPARAITGITVNNESFNAVGINGGSTPCDLNKGAGGDDIFMHMQRTALSDEYVEVSTEEQLRDVITINNANIRLADDITLSDRGVVTNGITATIDLNDHKLARSLTSSLSTGQVLQVDYGGTLTLTDSSSEKKGCVTGGWATNNGGGIWVQGNLILKGGIISGNKAEWGGGIFIKPEGSVTMTGGTITENTVLKNGGGIYIQGTLNMSGCPVVERNSQSNLYLLAGKVVNVTGAFSTGAKVGVTTVSSDIVITSGYSTNNPNVGADAYFSSDRYSLTLEGGEVKQIAPKENWENHRSGSFASDYHVETRDIWIKNEAELALLAYQVNNGVDRFYKPIVHLEADLDMSGYEWTPIGTADRPFMGNFDGQGHTISGIWINPNNTGDYQGLFGYVKGMVRGKSDGCDYIKNLTLTNTNVTGGKYVGGVAGFVLNQATLQNIFCQANVKGNEHVGGIVGRGEGHKPGGNWFAMGGNWAGLFDPEARTTLEDCILTDGIITGTSNAGIIVGSKGDPVDVRRCYYINPASIAGNTNDVRAYPITLKSLPTGVTINYTSDGANYNNQRYAPAGKVDFKVNNTNIGHHVVSVKVNGTEVGTSTGNYSFTLNPESDNVITVETMHTTDMEGIGTQDNPYKIMSAEHWNHIAQEAEEGHLAAGQYFELGADIQVATMIGSATHPFSGHFDGKDHTLTVSNGSAESPLDADYAAPFRYFDGGSIKNLHIVGDIYTSAKFAAGSVACQSGTVAIENCRCSVAIHSSKAGDASHGGLVALNNSGSTLTITGCLFDGRLLSEGSTLTTHCGGFIGWRARSATIYNSFFDPAEVTVGNDDGATFARNGVDSYNCYFTYLLCDGTKNVPTLSDGNANPKKYSNGQLAYPITGIDGVTVAISGNAIATYSVSGLTIYNGCITRAGASTIYSAKGNVVQLSLSGSDNGYIPSDGTLTGSTNPYTLTMGTNTYIMPMPDALETIASADDWIKFCWIVNNGVDSYSGKTVTMTANIGTTEHPVTLMAGSSASHKFMGTFDGGGHTLTFAATDAEEFCAPFRYIDGATIQNLHTAGTISTSNMKAAGIVAEANGTSAITNCRSSMEIVSRRSGDGTHGGLVGFINGGTTTIEGCLFYGKLLGSKTSNCGGFVGWTEGNNSASVTIKNSLFIPETITIGTNDCATFSRGRDSNTKNITVTNCYYSEAFGKVQGGEAYDSETKPANIGEEGTSSYSVTLITEYTNGLKFGNSEYFIYIMTPEAVSLADAADNSQTISDKNGYLASVTLTDRTLYKDGKWNTLCLPFDVVLEDSPLEGAVARPLSGASITGTTLNLTFGEPVKTLVAGTPYIIKWASGKNLSNPVFNGVLIDATDRSYDNGSGGDSRVRFMGSYKSTTFGGEDKSILLMGSDNTLFYPSKGAGIGAQRAYFKIGDTAHLTRSLTNFTIDFGEEETTGILEAEANSSLFTLHSSLSEWYSLDGRKVNGKSVRKGLYIYGGKKVVIK